MNDGNYENEKTMVLTAEKQEEVKVMIVGLVIVSIGA